MPRARSRKPGPSGRPKELCCMPLASQTSGPLPQPSRTYRAPGPSTAWAEGSCARGFPEPASGRGSASKQSARRISLLSGRSLAEAVAKNVALGVGLGMLLAKAPPTLVTTFFGDRSWAEGASKNPALRDARGAQRKERVLPMLAGTPPSFRGGLLGSSPRGPAFPAAASLPSRVLPPALARRLCVTTARRHSRRSDGGGGALPAPPRPPLFEGRLPSLAIM